MKTQYHEICDRIAVLLGGTFQPGDLTRSGRYIGDFVGLAGRPYPVEAWTVYNTNRNRMQFTAALEVDVPGYGRVIPGDCYPYSERNQAEAKITVAATRQPTRIANDIAGRLLKKADTIWKKVQDRRREAEEAANARIAKAADFEAAARELGLCLERIENLSQQTVIHYRTHVFGYGITRIEVAHGEVRINARGINLPPAAAAQVLKIIQDHQ